MLFFRTIDFVSLARTSGHGEVRSDLGADGAANEQAHHNVEGFEAWDDTFHTHEDDLGVWNGGGHTTIPFISNEGAGTGLSNTKVAAGHTNVGVEEFFADEATDELGFAGWVFVAGVAVTMEDVTNGHAVEVQRWHNDVAWWVPVVQLQDDLSKVGFEHFNAMIDQSMVDVDFFGDHGFALYHFLSATVFEDLDDLLHSFFVGLCKVDMGAGFFCVFSELGQVIVEIVENVVADAACFFAQIFPFRYFIDEGSALAVENVCRGGDGVMLKIVRDAIFDAVLEVLLFAVQFVENCHSISPLFFSGS